MASVSINKCTFIGNLGKDIETKVTPAGLTIANFSMACSKSVKKGDNWENKTEWIPVVVFGKTAEYLSNKAGKGTTLYVEGEFTTSNYEKDGVKVYKTQIVASEVKIVSGKTEVQQEQQQELPGGEVEGDLPF